MGESRPDGEIRSSASGEHTVNLSNCLAARDGTVPLTSARNTVLAKATPLAQLFFLETNYRNTLYTSYEQIKLKPQCPYDLTEIHNIKEPRGFMNNIIFFCVSRRPVISVSCIHALGVASPQFS